MPSECCTFCIIAPPLSNYDLPVWTCNLSEFVSLILQMKRWWQRVIHQLWNSPKWLRTNSPNARKWMANFGPWFPGCPHVAQVQQSRQVLAMWLLHLCCGHQHPCRAAAHHPWQAESCPGQTLHNPAAVWLGVICLEIQNRKEIYWVLLFCKFLG